MNERDFTSKDIQESIAQQTNELREMYKTLSFWLTGVHYPSEGGYLEYVVRSYLRRRIPKRFDISTGFISTIKNKVSESGIQSITRKVSRQFDIIIWDSAAFPPLFRADDFVIVVPESVRVIIEITKSLTKPKMEQDLEKFDDLNSFYSGERQKFSPFTAILAFSSKLSVQKALQNLEKFYLFDSNYPIPFRYKIARNKKLEVRPCSMSGFIDSICILDQGLIEGELDSLFLDSGRKRCVRYISYENEPNLDTAFGLFERQVVLYLSQAAAELSGQYESSIDIYKEFMHMALKKPCASLIIEDWDSIMPSLNIMDKVKPITPYFPENIENISGFVGVDFTINHPKPKMYIQSCKKKKIYAFERHHNNIFACGLYDENLRSKRWHFFGFNQKLNRSFSDFYKVNEINFSETLETIKTITDETMKT